MVIILRYAVYGYACYTIKYFAILGRKSYDKNTVTNAKAKANAYEVVYVIFILWWCRFDTYVSFGFLRIEWFKLNGKIFV